MQLVAQIEFVPHLAGGRGPKSERYPVRVDAWLTHEAHERAVSCTLSSPRTTCALKVPITTPQTVRDVYAPLRDAGAYTFAGVGRAFEPDRLSRSTRLAFALYARTDTDDGCQVWTRVGGASLNAERVKTLLASTGAVVGVEVVQNQTNELAPRAPGARPCPGARGGALVKGTLRLRLSGVAAPEWDALFLASQAKFDTASDDERAERAALMNAVVTRSMRAFTARDAFLPRASLPFLERFHCPEERLDDTFAPSAAYFANQPRSVKRDYYRRALRIVLRRRALDASDAQRMALALARYIQSPTASVPLEAHEALGIVVRVATLYGSTMPYLDDWNNDGGERAETDEDMYVSRLAGADDCEGSALENLMCVRDLIALADMPASKNDAVDYLLGVAGAALRHYVPCTALLAVSNRQLTYAAAHMRQADALAHTACVLVPLSRFLAWCEPAVRTQLAAAAPASDPRLAALPILMCEGTTRMAPELLPLDSYFAQAGDEELRAATENLAARVKRSARVQAIVGGTRLCNEIESTHANDAGGQLAAGRRDISHFYKHVVALQTMLFGSTRTFDFTLVYKRRRTYGVTFNDFLLPANHDKIGIVPHLELSAYEAAIVDMQIGVCEPVPPLAAATRPPPLPDALAALADRPPTAPWSGGGVPLQPRTVTLSARLADIGPRELAALCAARHDACLGAAHWTVRVERLCDALVPGGEPLDIVDVTLRF